ncbi:MAG TPA: imidazole glycerol phosphate synthase subunit HisH [Gaiellaceae bacterium]|nr:imidazole glycerol phosphate synthase subunit HisH [Gaiellaceae bacterium]
MAERIAVIDYGMGNLRSVTNAFASLGASPAVVTQPDELADAERIVLPGVGAFADGMQNLRDGGWVDALEEQVRRKGKPFLGLCIGMQVLADRGTEHGSNAGLGWIAGTVERIASDNGLRVPHIGWNDVTFTPGHAMYDGLGESDAFYFVHSYVLRPDDDSVVSGVCEYGGDFAASVETQNIRAAQFHPEKSHRAGLRLLKNFLEWR